MSPTYLPPSNPWGFLVYFNGHIVRYTKTTSKTISIFVVFKALNDWANSISAPKSWVKLFPHSVIFAEMAFWGVNVYFGKTLFYKGILIGDFYLTRLINCLRLHRYSRLVYQCTLYKLQDYRDIEISGRFYGHDSKKANIVDVYLVQNCTRKKGDGVLLRWLGVYKTPYT